MDANLVLWIGQILLALAFLAVGYTHTLAFEQASTRPRTAWLAAVGRGPMRIIGILEVLGAIGLVVPAATGVLPWLTPLAAACLAVLMLFAIVFHARRPGEGGNIVFNAILCAIAAAVAYGRLVIAPL
jgi:uncharacterized membrane protein YphA (DoxX/SURF4 family)